MYDREDKKVITTPNATKTYPEGPCGTGIQINTTSLHCKHNFHTTPIPVHVDSQQIYSTKVLPVSDSVLCLTF